MIGNNNAIYFSRVIELERHIEILLLDNDCVIVPDLGGFMSHYIEARYDDRENLYLPPLRTLGFNPKLTMNDSLLAQSYVEAYDISFPEAISRIEKEVSELHQHLENEGYYELYDIGTLRLNGEGNYEFEPCEAGILTPSLYGLNTLEIDKIVPVAPIAEPLRQPAQEQKEPAERAIHIKMSTLRKTAAIAAAIALLVMLAIPVGNSTRQFPDTCKIDKSWFYRIMPKEITSNKPATVNQKASKPKPATVPATVNKKASKPKPAAPVKDEPKQPVVEEKVQEPATYWTIVLASQVSKKNAELFATSLQKQGYAEATVVLRRNGNKVVMGRFSSETEAQNRVRTLRQESADFAEAWVMKMQEP